MTINFKYWVLAAALALPGCIIVDHDDGPGTLTVSWTIDGLDDPADCDFYGIDRLELSVYDVFDDAVLTSYPYCEDFAVSVSLPEGFYSADVTLVDRLNQAVTTTQTLDSLDVFEDEELIVPVDFPARSFL